MSGRWELRPGWAWTTASTIAEIVGGGTPKASEPENFSKRGIPWVTPADLSGYEGATITRGRRDLSEKGYKASGARLLPAGSVLFSSRAPIGYCVIASNPIATNQGFKSLRLWSTEFVPEFIRYYLLSAKQYAESLASGTTFKELSAARMGELLVPIAPRNEQRRIVAKLEALQSRSRRARDALDAVPPLLEKLRQSILAAAYRGDLTRDWREKHKDVEPASKLLERIRAERRTKWEEAEFAKMRARGKVPTDDRWKAKYKHPEPVDTTGLPELPWRWCWTRADDVCISVVDCHNKTAPYVESGIPLIRTTNIRNGLIDLLETKFVDERTYAFWSRRCPPEPGDIIFTREAPMGEAGMVPPDTRLCMGQRMMLLRADGEMLRRKFLLYAVQAPFVSTYAARLSVGTGVQHLRVRDVEALPVPLAPADEQKVIEDAIDGLLARYSTVSAAMTGLRVACERADRSILAQAFRGELVPQDSNDEPAEAMLARLLKANSVEAVSGNARKNGLARSGMRARS
ncbi:MAG: restriction endonuclease subunit S [Myxococcales bacterium]|nr:restriction endonuclease subunit S [Myxococcales bacterium]